MNEGRSPDTWSAVNGNGPWFSERGVWCEPIDALRSVHDSAQPLLESRRYRVTVGTLFVSMWDPIRQRVPVATRDPLAECVLARRTSRFQRTGSSLLFKVA
ncbi:MAG: hypothetical protein R3B96_23030 [Pirellulaceae bacterium]